MSTPRALLEWQSRALAEYRSAAITAQVLHRCIQIGLPGELLEIALRIVGDELTHADLSADVVEALGGDWDAAPVDVNQLQSATAPEGVLASLVDSLLVNFLFGETLAVPLFNAMRKGSTHPAVLAVLERVLRDEAVHRAFGWAVVDALLEIDGPGVRERIQAALPTTLERFESAYSVHGPPLLPVEREVGLLDPDTWRAVFETTRDGDLRDRFAAREIHFPV